MEITAGKVMGLKTDEILILQVSNMCYTVGSDMYNYVLGYHISRLKE